MFFFDNETFRCLIEFTTLYSVARQLAGDEIHEIFADVDSDKSDLSLDRDEGTEGESDSEVITPGPHNLNLHLLNLTMLLCHLTMSALNKG